MPHVDNFRELKVYQRAFENARLIFERSKEFPAAEKYALTDQIRRSSRAVCAMIAEAWSFRRYTRAFVNKLIQATGELCETQVWLDISLHSGYITTEEHNNLNNALEHVAAMLYKMISRPEVFCTPKRGRTPRD